MKQDDRAEIALAATAGDRYLAQTHEVLNQPAALVDYNLYTTDRALQDAVAIQGGGRLRRRRCRLSAPGSGPPIFSHWASKPTAILRNSIRMTASGTGSTWCAFIPPTMH